MAGQSVGLIEKEQPVAEILAELVAQAVAALERDDAVAPATAEAAE
jgi:enoyl-[acyl-carrier protein] reductase II